MNIFPRNSCPRENPYNLDANTDGCVDTINAIIDEIKNLALKEGITTSLTTKLENAQKSLEAENSEQRNDAINKIESFINEAEAQRRKELTEEQADLLIRMVNNVIMQLTAGEN